MNDRLEVLKKQVRDTSDFQDNLKQEINRAEQSVMYEEKKKQENEREMANFIKSVMGKSELIATKERELFKDSIEKFSNDQAVMNRELIALNDFLTDTTSLQAIYNAKREAMEHDLENEKEVLLENIYKLKKECHIKELELERIDSMLKRKREIVEHNIDDIQKVLPDITTFKMKSKGFFNKSSKEEIIEVPKKTLQYIYDVSELKAGYRTLFVREKDQLDIIEKEQNKVNGFLQKENECLRMDNHYISERLKRSNERIKSMREAIKILDKDTRETLEDIYHKILDEESDNQII